MHTRKFFDKVISTTLKSNPMVIEAYMQYKMYQLYLTEFIKNPRLVKGRQLIVKRLGCQIGFSISSTPTSARYSTKCCASLKHSDHDHAAYPSNH
jgi:hypothetical protein